LFLEVVVPGPWWHTLTYEFDRVCSRGARLRVPVGRGVRVAFATGSSSMERPFGEYRVLSALEAIDDRSPLGWELFNTSEKIGKHFLCGFGEALKAVAPASVISGKSFEGLPEMDGPRGDFNEERCDSPDFSARSDRYLEVIESSRGGVLALFPDRSAASAFWKKLPEKHKKDSLLWLSAPGPASDSRWERVRRGNFRLVVGSPAALFAPLTSVSAVIVEDEGNPSYLSRRFPFIHARSAAGSRAQSWGATLVTGGGVPSSRSFFRMPRECPREATGRMVFVDMGMARKISVRGIQSPLLVSDSALKRTQAEVSGGRPVLWILDRKGYAGAVICSECGRMIVCPSCGLPVRWDDKEEALVCGFCGKKTALAEVCPFCGAISLQGMKPGLESLRHIGENVLGDSCPVYIWHADIRQTVSARKDLVKGLASGGLVVGSRKAIELCDHLEIGLVCWLDADMAVNTPFYDARSRAFRMVWESAWRGKGNSFRTVLIQSRVPGSGWQKGLAAGWDHFWRAELMERKELGLPPWRYLVEIRGLKGMKAETRDLLATSGIECLDPDPLEDMLWARSGNLSRVRKALAPLFHISRSGRGFPRIEVWAD